MTSVDTSEWAYEDTDAALPASYIDYWDETHGMPEGFVAYIQPADDAESPREWDNASLFACEGNDFTYDECTDLKRLLDNIRTGDWEYAAEQAGYVDDDDRPTVADEADLIATYFKEELDALAWDSFSFGSHHRGGDTMWAYIPRSNTYEHLLGDPKYANDIVAWLALSDDEDRLQELADERLAGEIHVFKMWDEGDVYDVHVIELRTGREASLHQVFDEYPYKHCLATAKELTQEVE